MGHEVFDVFAADFNGTLIDAISDQSVDPGAQVQTPVTDGQADPKLIFVGTHEPVVDLTTQAIGTALTALGSDIMEGLAITGALNEITLYARAMAELGSRSATGALQIVVNEGLVVPVSVSAGNGPEPGTLGLQVVPSYDGTNLPFVMTASQSLVGSPAADEAFFVGPAKLNNVALDGIQSVSIQFGIEVRREKEAGVVDPTFVYIAVRRPVITLTTQNVGLHATYQRGVAVSSLTKCHLRKALAGGGRELDASTVHPTFTVNEGMIISRAMSGSPQTLAIDIIPSKDASNPQIVYAVGAIT